MKKYLYICLLSLLFHSCQIIQDDRPPSVIGPKTTIITTPAPAYIPPFCSPVRDKTNSGTTNFNVFFPDLPQITLIDNTLTFKTINDMNDQLIIKIKPFVKGQSTVYSLVSPDKILEDYESSIQFIANSMSSTDKFNAKSESNVDRYLHFRSNTSGTSYEMIFCNTTFRFYFNSQFYTSWIEGNFIFDY